MVNSVQAAQMPLQKIIPALQAAAYAYTAWRLFARRLAKRQAALIGFLLLRCFVMTVSLVPAQASDLYFWTYVIFTPLDCLVSVLAVREAIGLVLDDYPGIRAIGRWTMYGAVVVALASALVIAAAFWRGPEVRSNLYYIEVSNRSVVFGLAVVLTSLLIFLSHYPLNLSRNRLVSSVAFGAIVLSEAVALFIDSQAEHLYSPMVDLAAIGFGAICLVVWGAMLQPYEAVARPPQNRARDERLLRQLKALEQTLSKAGGSGPR